MPANDHAAFYLMCQCVNLLICDDTLADFLLTIHKLFHKLFTLHYATSALFAGYFVESLHTICFDAGIVDEEWYRVCRVGTVFTRCRMIGKDSNGDGLVPTAYFFEDGAYDATVQIFDCTQLQGNAL